MKTRKSNGNGGTNQVSISEHIERLEIPGTKSHRKALKCSRKKSRASEGNQDKYNHSHVLK